MASSAITTIPIEVLACILECLPSVNDLGRCLFVCRRFYSAVTTSPRSIAEAIVRRQIPAALLPHAVAVMEWSPRMPPFQGLPPESPGSIGGCGTDLEVHSFVYKSEAAALLARRLRDMPIDALAEMSHEFEIANAAAKRFAADAWDRFLGLQSGVHEQQQPIEASDLSAKGNVESAVGSLQTPLSEPINLSDDEYIRIIIIFYIFMYFGRVPGDVEDPISDQLGRVNFWLQQRHECISELIDREAEKVPNRESGDDTDDEDVQFSMLPFKGFTEFGERFSLAKEPVLYWIGRLLSGKAWTGRNEGDWTDGVQINTKLLNDESLVQEITRRTLNVIVPDNWSDADYCKGRGAYMGPVEGDVLSYWAPGDHSHEELRACGYPFWDLDRLERHGLLDQIGIDLIKRGW